MCAPELLNDPSIEYGFLLHDLGKIGIPDDVLQKPAPLSVAERRLIETHTMLGEQMLEGVSFMSPECLSVIRSHHERWDGDGYPDGLVGDADPPRRARVRRRGRARRDHERPALPQAADLGVRGGGDRRPVRASSSTPKWSTAFRERDDRSAAEIRAEVASPN